MFAHSQQAEEAEELVLQAKSSIHRIREERDELRQRCSLLSADCRNTLDVPIS